MYSGNRLAEELEQAGIPFEREVKVPVIYKKRNLPLGFRADIIVDQAVLVEIKAVAAILPTHEVQLLTYLRMSGLQSVC